jgi:A/G-specific adenine glycosylase
MYDGKIYIRKRAGNDIWKNLHEFLLIETTANASSKRLLAKAEKEKILKKDSYKILSVSPVYSQQLSHQKIMGRFVKLALKKEFDMPGFKAIDVKQQPRYAFPRFINAFFEKRES